MREIKLTQGQVALVDDADYEWLNQWKWCASRNEYTFYAKRIDYSSGIKKKLFMHRLILGLTDPKILGDHKDRNGLNNQRFNLRSATHRQNMSNRENRKNSTSKYLGVSWVTYNKKWRAQICDNREIKYLGLFISETEAAEAYNKAAKIIHGEFANPNIF